MSNRRQFLLGVTANVTATAISGLAGSRRVLGANDRVRLGLIGAGGRGKEILREALACPNTEAVAVADIYTRRHDEVKRFAPAIKAYTDFRHLLDDSSIDAVLIASPQHLHALHFVPALEAGKDVYQEKTMAFNVDHAKRMRRAFRASNRVVQIGIQSTSDPSQSKARELAASQRLGVITAIHSHMYRNAPYGGWLRPIPQDCDPQHWTGRHSKARPNHTASTRIASSTGASTGTTPEATSSKTWSTK
jgi:predicted dehydrogenase